ncbi:MAG: PQQ-binding-like beta-propeller repeat protein, partial [Planctomycetaceae bacterium]|nr:PQQ-binding-like beta-propeller repeat protein [Planctomycetaceae bacterium]
MRTLCLMLGLLLTASCLYAADNWPQFRGPHGDGHAGKKSLPLEWSEDQNVKWKTPIHGKGWSSPVIWDNQIWMTTATEDGKKMYAVCVDANSGKVLHDLLVFENADPAFCHPTNSYASPTPVIEQGRLY